MKRLLVVPFSMASVAIIGCEASAKIGDSDDTGSSYTKKTVEKTSPDSNTTVQRTTETQTNP